MQSITITTRGLGPTSNKGDRIEVTTDNGLKDEFPYPYSKGLDEPASHEYCVRQLLSDAPESKVPGEFTMVRTGRVTRGFAFQLTAVEESS